MATSLEHDASLARSNEAQAAVPGFRSAWTKLTDASFMLAALALAAGCIVLTGAVIYHYIQKYTQTGTALVWKNEVAIYLIAGSVFLAAATTQARRGHVGIMLLAHYLSPKGNRIRSAIIDVAVLAFCVLFSWETAKLLIEAIQEGQLSNTVWGPPLWVPYTILAFGMALLAIQVALQVAEQSWIRVGVTIAVVVAFLLWNSPPEMLKEYIGGRAPFHQFITDMPQWMLGVLYCAVTLLIMFSGMPIAFSLGIVAVVFSILFMRPSNLESMALNFYEELAQLGVLAIPPFILQGAIIGRSNAGKDVYSALHAWLHKVPGGLGIANTVACGFFAAMAGSSPATCSAIGATGIPEMRARGYSGGFAAGIIAAGGTLGILIPPSVTMVLYAVAAEVSLGRLFTAGFGPGILLIVLFSLYSVMRFRKEKRIAHEVAETTGVRSAILHEEHYTLSQKFRMLILLAPFMIIMGGVMVVLYQGLAEPSDTAAVAAVLAFAVVALMYGAWRPSKMMPILTGSLSESTMLMMIIGTSLLYANVMSGLNISQSTAAWIISLGLSPWVLFVAIVIFVIFLGFFLPPVSIILMTAPIILPPLKAAGFDLIWFGVIMTIVMEMGLIHPPVGLNLFVIKSIAPDIPLMDIVWGTLPFVFLMAFGVLILCVFPDIAMWLPNVFFPDKTVPS